MSDYATILMVVKVDSEYDSLQQAALSAAGIPRQPTEESMFLKVSPGISPEALSLGADPSEWDEEQP